MNPRIGVIPNRSVTAEVTCQHAMTKGKRKGQKCGKSAYYANNRCWVHDKTNMSEKNLKDRVGYADATSEYRDERLVRQRERYHNVTPEQREKCLAHACEHMRERRANETPEQCEKRLAYQRAYQRKKYNVQRPRNIKE